MTVSRARRLEPAAVGAAVAAAFGLESVSGPLELGGCDSVMFAASCAAVPVLVRWEAFEGRPVAAAASWCARLADAGAPVARPVAAADGRFVVADGAGDWSCWVRLDGRPVAADERSAACAGRLLADLHGRFSLRPAADDPPAALYAAGPRLRAGSAVHRHAADVLAALDGGHLVVAHMDFHPGNLLDVGGELHVVDWVDGGAASTALDVAVAAAYWGAAGGVELAAALLSGYGPLPFDSSPLAAVWAAAVLLGVRCDAHDGDASSFFDFAGVLAGRGALAG